MMLGAVLAGGQSTRFGSDRAPAELGGHTLMDRAMIAFAEAIIARPVKLARNPANIDTPADLAAAEARDGL